MTAKTDSVEKLDRTHLAHIIARAHAAAAPHIEATTARRLVETAAANEAAKRSAAELAARARLARLASAGVPGPHIKALMTGDLDMTRHAVRVVARWRSSEHHTLVLSGDLGTGKSRAAAWLLDQGPRVRYLHPNGYEAAVWPDELAPRWRHAGRLARASMFGTSGGASEVDLCERCALLVIDDVGGAETVERSWVPRLDQIVSVRADAGLDTIMTTNLSLTEFAATYGERMLDRMRGDGRCWIQVEEERSMRDSKKWKMEERT